MNPVLVYLGGMVLAFFVEAIVEYVLGTPMDKIPILKPHKWLLMYVAMLVGVFVSWYYSVDIVAVVMEKEPTIVGFVFTGFAIGRGANWFNDLWQRYVARA